MMKQEPVTFLVLMMMIAILIFGMWSSWPTERKRSNISFEIISV
jgi:hypothetical protein